MRLVLTILAFAIVASLALLPLGASAAGFDMAGGDARLQMHASSDVSMDCCLDGMKGAPFHTDGYKCGMGLCCTGGLVALEDVRSVGFRFVPTAESRIAIPTDQVITVHSGTPPFRPPRV